MVAIIDSGIQENVFNDVKIEQYRVYMGKAVKEYSVDYIGHGTAMASIILRKSGVRELLSVVPGINDEGIADTVISASDIEKAIRFSVDMGANIIIICMGTTQFSKRQLVDEACAYARKKDSVIICAQPNEDYPALPWACQGVIRVVAGTGNSYEIQTIVNEIIKFQVDGKLYKVILRNGKTMYSSGNSCAAAWLSAIYYVNYYTKGKTEEDFYRDYMPREYEKNTSIRDYKFNTFPKKYNNFNMVSLMGSKIVLLPFIKEMHSIIRFQKEIGYKVVGVIDSYRKGTIGKDIGYLMKEKDYGIIVSSNLKDIQEADWIIIGYLDDIIAYDPDFTIDSILQMNLNTLRANVYSIEPVDIKWVELYLSQGLNIISTPIVNENELNELISCVHWRDMPISKPVMGIFGTSSNQGKFTLQIKIREEIKQRGKKCFHLSTEHQGLILGADAIYPDGYSYTQHIKLELSGRLEYLKRLMVYIDNTSDADIIIVGNQSWTIPFNIHQQTFMRNAVFLEATLPDLAVLVVNPLLDPEELIMDNINVLKGIYKCQVIAIAFSDYTPYLSEEGISKKRKLTKHECNEATIKLYNKFRLLSGCILDEGFINKVVNRIFEICD